MRNFFKEGMNAVVKHFCWKEQSDTFAESCVLLDLGGRGEVESRRSVSGRGKFLGERCHPTLSPLGIIRVVSGRQFITRWVTTLARSDALLARNSAVGARIVRQDRAECEVSVVGGVPEIVPHSCKTTSTKYHAMRFVKYRHFFNSKS